MRTSTPRCPTNTRAQRLSEGDDIRESSLETEPRRSQDVSYRPRRRCPTRSSAAQGDSRTPVLIRDGAGDGICARAKAPKARDARGDVFVERIDPELTCSFLDD